MEIFEKILELNSVRALFTYIVLLLILILLFFLKISKDESEREYLSRIIGGFTVFIFAVISNNSYIMFVSLFVGGLVIASEDFMKNLAIIFRSNSADIAKNLATTTTPATPAEKEEKANEEEVLEKVQEENIPASHESQQAVQNDQSKRQEWDMRRVTIKKVEELVFNYYNSIIGARFQNQVKIHNEYGTVIVDGVIYSPIDPAEIRAIIEVVYIEDIDSNSFKLNFSIRRALERIRFLLIDKPLYIAIVSNSLTEEIAERLNNRFKSKGIRFHYFKFENEKIIPLRKSHLLP